MEDVKGTENIPDDCVDIIFDFCKAFNEAQDKVAYNLGFTEGSFNFSFDFQGRKFVCNRTCGSKKKSKMCIIDVSQDDHLVEANVEDKNKDNIALVLKQGNSIGSNYYLFVKHNTIFLAKENNDKKFDVYCFFLGEFCNAKIEKNDDVKSKTVKIASNIEKKKIQAFFKNVKCGQSSEFIVMLMAISLSNPTERTVVLKKFFNANAFSPEEVIKINDEANSSLCKFNCCGLCG